MIGRDICICTSLFPKIGVGTESGKFERRTNFNIDIICKIQGPPTGFVYRIRTSDGVTRLKLRVTINIAIIYACIVQGLLH